MLSDFSSLLYEAFLLKLPDVGFLAFSKFPFDETWLSP